LTFGRLPRELIYLSKMTRLLMFHNGLQELDPVLGQLTNLRELELSSNPVESLPASLRKLTALETLRLAHLPIHELPLEIGLLRRLHTLEIEHCSLTRIPKEIGLLWNLKTLKLKDTMLEYLPEEVCDLQGLEMLDLRDNKKLRALPTKIGKLRKLSILAICNLPLLDVLPPELKRCHALYYLVAKKNPQLHKPVVDGGFGVHVGEKFSGPNLSNLRSKWRRILRDLKRNRKLLLYFHCALESDTPILEALWISRCAVGCYD